MDLAGKKAVVAGAGSGIGRAMSARLAAEGARLIVADLDAEALQETVASIEREGGRATFTHIGDPVGIQMIGAMPAAVHKRIDRAATAILNGNAVNQLNDLDLSYTPPLGSPWDVLQAAGQQWVHALPGQRRDARIAWIAWPGQGTRKSGTRRRFAPSRGRLDTGVAALAALLRIPTRVLTRAYTGVVETSQRSDLAAGSQADGKP